VWNAFSESEGPISKWILKSFGKAPVLMSWVNPALRASVAQSVLKNHGYFNGKVTFRNITMSNSKKAKIAYDVNMGHLYTIDSVSYNNFPEDADSLLNNTLSESIIHKGDPFDVSSLDAERVRVSSLFRNNGYYYYQPAYASYLADTLSIPGKVQMKFLLADQIPEKAKRKWYIGNVNLMLRKQIMEQLGDSLVHRRFTVHFNGKHSPIRPRVIMRDLKLRSGNLYSYNDYLESSNKITGDGLFSIVDFQFSPRDTSANCDTLDLALNCVFDKPYDFYVETNYTGRTSGRMGPGLILGFTKRNAFRGGEKLDINLKGSYEWQSGHSASGSGDNIHSYEYGGDVSLEFPRLILPFMRHSRFFTTPSTVLKASTDIINRAGYFKRHVASGELTYTFQTSKNSMHQFSPLILEYEYMSSHSAKFDSVMAVSPYLQVSMKDQFIPKMRYSYIYTSDKSFRNPIWWQTTVSEAANILSLGYAIAGNSWNEKDKKMFKNPYAQYVKIETEFRKTWRLAEHSNLVAHFDLGAIWAYGNSDMAPWSEQFYIGGANSVRAFTVRSVGPGAYYPTAATSSYLDQTGDIKILANLEYRPRIFGNLYGAVFLDAGNVWTMHDSSDRPGGKFLLKNVAKEMAVGTGVGLRYDLDFFVIRVDWGIGLHLPYKSGFYNLPNFNDSQSLHLAIGMPF
jgi:outer membrane protein assembly factor BamA